MARGTSMATRLRAQRLPRTVRVEGRALRARLPECLTTEYERSKVGGRRAPAFRSGAFSPLAQDRALGSRSEPISPLRSRGLSGEAGRRSRIRGMKWTSPCCHRTYAFRTRSETFRSFPELSETFRFVPELSGTFRFVPFCSVWFRTDFLLPGAELRVLSAEC